MEDLKVLRIQRGYSLDWMARKCGIDPRRLGEYESGRRQWPRTVLEKSLELLGYHELGSPVPILSWSQHRKFVGRPGLNLAVDSGQTWADIPSYYQDLYRQLDPKRIPDLGFRSKVRVDSGQEPLGWTQLFEDGAEAVGASPILLDFPYHPLVDSRGRALTLQPRAAFTGRIGPHDWILFPQITLSLRDGLYRPDGLLFRSGGSRRYAVIQLDGGAHQNDEWDKKQDARVKVETLRFPSRTILGLNFAQAFRERLIAL